MIKKTSRLFLAAAASFAAVACGGSDGGPSYASSADSATIADFADISGNVAQSALYDVFGDQNYNFPLPDFSSAGSTNRPVAMARAVVARMIRTGELRRGRPLLAHPASRLAGPSLSAPFHECTPTTNGADELGNPIDTDGDGIADDYSVNFGSACVIEDSAGTERTTISGSVRIQDTNIGFFSFKLTVSNLKIVLTDLTTGDSFSQAVNGSETASFAAALASHVLNVGLKASATSDGTTISATETLNETASFDPDGAGTLSLGGGLPNGVFDYNADLAIVGENSGGELPGNFRFKLETTTPLHFNTSCISDIDAGVFRGSLNGGSTVGFTLTWSSCADPVLDIFGDTPPAATIAAR